MDREIVASHAIHLDLCHSAVREAMCRAGADSGGRCRQSLSKGEVGGREVDDGQENGRV